jgi:hypothetical protein
MPRYVLRVWLPDRPGALGQVAGRIGAAGGDVIGIEILERGAGRAIDELVVDLPDEDGREALVREVLGIEGVDLESIEPLGRAEHDPQLALLEAAARQVSLRDEGGRLDQLCTDVRQAFEADWAVVVDVVDVVDVGGPDGAAVLSADGAHPGPAWVSAFVAGSRHLEEPHEHVANDVAWAGLGGADRVVAVGREGRPFRVRERRQLEAFARISGGLSPSREQAGR